MKYPHDIPVVYQRPNGQSSTPDQSRSSYTSRTSEHIAVLTNIGSYNARLSSRSLSNLHYDITASPVVDTQSNGCQEMKSQMVYADYGKPPLPKKVKQLKRSVAMTDIRGISKSPPSPCRQSMPREWKSATSLNPATPRLQAIREFCSTGDIPEIRRVTPKVAKQPTSSGVKIAIIRKLSDRSATTSAAKTRRLNDTDTASILSEQRDDHTKVQCRGQSYSILDNTATKTQTDPVPSKQNRPRIRMGLPPRTGQKPQGSDSLKEGFVFKTPSQPVVRTASTIRTSECMGSTCDRVVAKTTASSDFSLVPVSTHPSMRNNSACAGSLSAIFVLHSENSSRLDEVVPSSSNSPAKTSSSPLYIDSLDKDLVCDLKRQLMSRIKTNGSLRARVQTTHRLGVNGSPRRSFKTTPSHRRSVRLTPTSQGALRELMTIGTVGTRV